MHKGQHALVQVHNTVLYYHKDGGTSQSVLIKSASADGNTGKRTRRDLDAGGKVREEVSKGRCYTPVGDSNNGFRGQLPE